LEEKNSGWEGHSSKRHWIYILHIGKIHFVINQSRDKRMTERREIN